MAVVVLQRFGIAACAIAAFSVMTTSASAQNMGPGRLRRLAGSCQAETARFCPAIQPGVPRARDQMICLRPYRTSLSLGCRSALDQLAPR